MRLVDETGNVYGRWTVLSRAAPTGGSKRPSAQWLCQCACGRQAVVFGNHLRLGRSVSCGCSKTVTRKKQIRAINARRRKRLMRNPTPPKVKLPRCEFSGVPERGYRGPNPKKFENSPRCRGLAKFEMTDGKRFCYMHANLKAQR